MKKVITTMAVALAMAAGSSAASATDLTGWYVNGSVGSVHSNAKALGYDLGSTNSTAGNFTLGYHAEYIGFELGYTDLGSYRDADDVGDRLRLSAGGITLGISAHFNPTPQWYITPRVGGIQWRLKSSATVNDGSQSESASGVEHGTGYYVGVGTGYDINRHWSVGIAYDYYQIKKSYQKVGNFQIRCDVASVRAEYRF